MRAGRPRIALFHSIPVTTPPVAAKSYPVTSFPAAYSLPVPAGSYKVYAFLDVASDGYVASEGDPRSPAQDATIPAEGTFVQDITLE